MTTPFLGAPELAAAQSQPEVTVDTALRVLDAAISISALDKDRTTPPVAPTLSDRYLVPAEGAIGAWTDHGNQVAYLRNSTWQFLTPLPGWLVYVQDEAQFYVWDGDEWTPFSSGGSSFASVVTEGGASLAATSANSGDYTRFTNPGAKTYVFDDEEAYVIGAEYHGRNVGAGELLISTLNAMVVNPPAGGSLSIPRDGTFTVKIVAADEADLFGITRPDGGT